jgi:hypothetical protein
MAATQTKNRTRRPATRSRKAKPARPVQEVLLDLAYLLHATRVVGSRPTDLENPGSRA